MGLVLSNNDLDCVSTSTAICEDNDCDHFCYAENGNPVCGCEAGWILFLDGKTCLQDECHYLLGLNCSHTCGLNIWNVAECQCPDSMELDTDGQTCVPVDPNRSSSLCDNFGCSVACFEDNGVAKCACPNGEDLDTDEKTCIPSDEETHIPKTNYIRQDKTIRPFASQNGCIHKKYNGFNAGEKLAYIVNCDASNIKNQWEYLEDTQQIRSVGSVTKGKNLCIQAKSDSKLSLSAVKIEECDDNDKQKWVMKDGEIRMAANEMICLVVPYTHDGEWIRTRGCNWKNTFLTFE